MTTPFLQGTMFSLRPISREDYEGPMRQWVNDRDVTRYLVRGTFPQALEAHGRNYDAMEKSTTELEFAITANLDHSAIGICGLHSLQWVARHAEFRILIGEKDFWGRGVGTEVCRLLTAYGFETLNFNKIWLGVNQSNNGALQSYKNTGYSEEGILRQEVYRNGRYYDVIRMSILRDEYEKVSQEWPEQTKILQQLRGLV